MPKADKYTPAQREAAGAAVVGDGLHPARVAEMAREGKLKTPEGEPVGAFNPPVATVKTWGVRHMKRMAGTVTTPLETMPARDAIENLRIRCVNASALLLTSYERQLKRRPMETDPDRLRQIIRVVREAAALPGPSDPRPPAPGKGPMDSRAAGKSRTLPEQNTLGGTILREAAGGVPRVTDRSPVGDGQVPETLSADRDGADPAADDVDLFARRLEAAAGAAAGSQND